MNLLTDYDDEASVSTTQPLCTEKFTKTTSRAIVISSAPNVDIRAADTGTQDFAAANKKIVYHNPGVDYMWTPMQGPQHPLKKNTSAQNTLLGFVEKHSVDDFNFHSQYHTFQSFGYASDPSVAAMASSESVDKMVGSAAKLEERNGATIWDSVSNQDKREAYGGIRKRKALGSGSDPSTYLGPWAPYEIESVERAAVEKGMAERAAAAKKAEEEKGDEKAVGSADVDESDPNAIPANLSKKDAKKAKIALAATVAADALTAAMAERTLFSGESVYDYQGHTYMHPPPELHPADHQCYVPKRCLHTWAGHTKGVNAIRWLPTYGHLLLSASMDNTVKIWDAYNKRKCLRSYLGHAGPVRDIQFTNDGKHFLSSSFDKYMKYWDTETGQCISRFTTGKIGYCVKFHPENQNEFLSGMQNKFIQQWDIRDGKIPVQTYEEHLGAVNAILFVDENRRFVSTSDDKKVLFWDYGIPVVIKHISEPFMHSVPSLALHPSGKWFAAQSMDNTVLIYGALDRFSLNTKKRFTGHYNAGYAAQVGFSPDGQFVVSGDGEGRCFFWDWKSSKILKKLKCHDQVTMGVEWHPINPSWTATCSWDGTIKVYFGTLLSSPIPRLST